MYPSKVELISHTPNALALLLYTKNTRLQGAESLEDIAGWPPEKQQEHLDYMKGTIKSSWEFVDYVFKISKVTRAFTHQFVRTRTGSYAQESQRTVIAKDGVLTPPNMDPIEKLRFGYASSESERQYLAMIGAGVSPQDARGILPTNTLTSIIAKFNLRTLHETANLRLCTRAQGEYQFVFRAMRDAVINVHPWAEPFMQVYCVNHGRCMFPHFKDCPIKKAFPMILNSPGSDNRVSGDIKDEWERTNFEAIPKLTGDGRTT